MEPLPPDPYGALGVAKDATPAAIKTAYRKAALRCHPDKVKDKGDEFHRISQAYDILGDDGKRQRYDDQLRLANLKKEVQERRASVNFDTRGSPHPSPNARSSWVFEERRPSRQYDDESFDGYFDPRANSRKYDGYEAATRRPPPPGRASRPDEARPRGNTNTGGKAEARERERERMEKKKQKSKATAQDRGMKYSFVDPADSDDSDDELFQARRRELERERMRYEQERARRPARRSDDEFVDERARKLNEQTSNVNEYIYRARRENVSPPPLYRAESMQEQVPNRRSSRDARPVLTRQSSAPKPKDNTPPKQSRSKDPRKPSRDAADEPPQFGRPVPPLYTANSSPPNIEIPTADSRRRPAAPEYETRTPPRPQRAETMPVRQSASTPDRRPSMPTPPRRNDSTPMVSSNLRHAVETNDSGYSTSNSPSEVQPPQFPPPGQSTKYYYGSDKDVDAGHDTILREPGKPKRRSPSPMSKDKDRRFTRPVKADKTDKADKTPPHSRSASYNYTSDREREQQSPRPSIDSLKRPVLTRSTSSRNKPSLERGSSMPTPKGSPKTSGTPLPKLKTGGSNLNKDPLFGEVVESPTDMWTNPWGRRVSEDANGRYAKQPSPERIPFSHPFRDGDYDGGSRRMSADTVIPDGREYLAAGSGRRGSADRPPTKFRGLRRAETFAAAG